jgi:uncharacterized protein YdhG (YjbR/CyaY superfamily)
MTIDDYIAAAPPNAQPILEKLRSLAIEICPAAEETISYKLPAFRQGKVFFYFAAFKHHIGIYPPVNEPAILVKKLQPYRGPKGNLQFQYKDGMPYDLIAAVIKALHASYAVTK